MRHPIDEEESVLRSKRWKWTFQCWWWWCMAGGQGRVKEERRARRPLAFVAFTGFVASALTNRFLSYLNHCCYQVAFQEINILFNRAHLVNCNFFFDRVPIRKKLFLKNYNSYIKSDEYSWDNILRANLCPKVTFGLWPFLWSNLAIFDFDDNFHPSNGGKDRQDLAHSCPRGWRRLSYKKIQWRH